MTPAALLLAIVARVATPLAPVDIAAALRDGHALELGAAPSTRRLAVATAQVLLENGRGRLVYCHNLGMIGAGEHEPAFRIAGHRMRAASDPLDGARAYWRAIRRGHSGALRYYDAGDARGAAMRLARSGYHRTDPETYAARMASLYAPAVRAVDELARATHGPPPPVTP